MMSNLTKEQLAAIEKVNKNTLVSAAAGSGKTHVLVSRICELVSSGKISIDRLVIMTFTRDAAKEMKNRIKLAIDDKINELANDNSDKELLENLINQSTMIQNAKISTIDSFCKNLIDENFSLLTDIDPNYRIGNNNELELIEEDVLSNIIEETCMEESYNYFYKCYINKGDSQIRDMLKMGLKFLSSLSQPNMFLDYHINNYDDVCKESKNKYINEIKNKILVNYNLLKDRIEEENEFYNITEEKNKNKLLDKIEKANIIFNDVKKLLDKEDNETFCEYLINTNFEYIIDRKQAVFGSEKSKFKNKIEEAEELDKTVNQYKNNLSINKNITDNSKILEISYMKLLKIFYERFENEKIKKNVISISDLQKYAIKLLYKNDDNNNLVFTDLALDLQKKYDEIYIDEYQDTSIIQEDLIRALSNDFNNNNVFMVGDLKQSIYKFRNAKPKLFVDKMNIYSKDTINNRLISLNKNFRSSRNVINITNAIFNNTMTEKFGQIDYINTSQLVHGRDEDDKKDKLKYLLNDDKRTEINILNIPSKKEDEEVVKYTVEDEIKLIANRIKKLHDEDGYQYRDIVILHRAPSKITKEFVNIFSETNIPIIAEMKSGFYQSYEIKLAISLLKTFDNPLNDIELTAVLRSKLYDINNQELVFLRYIYKLNEDTKIRKYFCLYDSINMFIYRYEYGLYNNNEVDDKLFVFNDEEEIQDDVNLDIDIIKQKYKIDIDNLYLKLRKFVLDLRYFTNISRYKTVSEVLNILYDRTNLYNYAYSLSNGRVRIGNLNLLLSNAKIYEQTSYVGLYNFIRFIEQIKERDDEGLASVFDENEDIVRFISIHKSKGLQYKVVIMPNLNKEYNMQDLKQSNPILFDDEYGVSLNNISYEKKYIAPTIKRLLIQSKMEIETKEEEARLFYVATTRAEEKLIMTFINKNTQREDRLDSYINKNNDNDNSYNELTKIKSYEGLLQYAIPKNQNGIVDGKNTIYIDITPQKSDNDNIISKEDTEVVLNIYRNEKIDLKKIDEYEEETDNIMNYNDIDELVNNEQAQNEIIKIKQNLGINDLNYDLIIENSKSVDINKIKISDGKYFEYKYDYLNKIKPKFSVSEIKNIEDNNIKQVIYKDDDEELTIDEDKKNNIIRVGGQDIGNEYHKFMEKFDYANIDLSDYKYIKKEYIDNFVNSQLGIRMKKAYENKKLYREQKFMKLFQYTDILKFRKQMYEMNTDREESVDEKIKNIISQIEFYEKDKNEDVIIQGIIDAFFIETNEKGEEEIVLVDYKTDGMKTGKINKKHLIDKYKIQLDLYKEALSSILNINIKQSYLYSFALSEEIIV